MESASYQRTPETSPLAIVSIVFGILGLFIFGSLIAIICGHIARSQIRDSNGELGGDGLALAGLITGYLGIALTVLFVVVFLIIGVGVAAAGM